MYPSNHARRSVSGTVSAASGKPPLTAKAA